MDEDLNKLLALHYAAPYRMYFHNEPSADQFWEACHKAFPLVIDELKRARQKIRELERNDRI